MKWLKKYSGQTTDKLLALASKYSPSSIIFRFEEGLDQKWEHLGFDALLQQNLDDALGRSGKRILTEEELTVLAIVTLQRQVHNGGYHQLFSNRAEFTPILEKASLHIGRPDIAAVSREAVEALGIDTRLLFDPEGYYQAINKALDWQNKAIIHNLHGCSRRFFDLEEDPDLLEVSLFNFIKANKAKIILPP